jgi:choline-sulfatase
VPTVRVLYVDCDTLRPDHLGCYGYHRDTSPNVDALAADGVLFTQMYASDVPCLPSRTALFSGMFGTATGVVGHAGRFARGNYPGDGHGTDPQRRPLAMTLADAGYRTTTFTTFHQRHLAWRFCAGWHEIQRFADTIGDEIATDLETPAIAWLRQHGEVDNWFLHLHFWDPHVPYNTPLEFGNPFADDQPPAYPGAEDLARMQSDYGPMTAPDLINDYHRPHPRMPRRLRDVDDYRQLIDGYDVGIRYFDDTLGRIMATLDELGVLDETAIVLSSDHGENQGELGMFTSHSSADAITCRVPLVVRWPGAPPALQSDALLYQLDLAPTLCELLGVEAPARWDGRSFASAVHGGPVEGRSHLVFGQGAWFVQRAVLDEGWLYLRTLHKALNDVPDEMLFDLRTDPHETTNLVEQQPQRLALMRDRLGSWWSDVADAMGGDPLLDMAAEGGAYYPRMFRDGFLQQLRSSGRQAAADAIAARYTAPVVDRFDLDQR